MKLGQRSLSLLALGMAALAAAFTAQGALAEEYVVREGDTLWDITGSHLKDPFRWKDVWDENKQIKNPHLIYPGNKITLPGETDADADVLGKDGKDAKDAAGAERDDSPFVERGKTITKRREVKIPQQKVFDIVNRREPVASEEFIMAAGFIAEDLDGQAKIIAEPGEAKRENFYLGDHMYLKAKKPGGIKAGDLLLSIVPDDDVDNPRTKKRIGTRVRTTGLLEVVSDEGDDIFRCEVKQSFWNIDRNNILLPYRKPEIVFDPVPENEAAKGLDGVIASTKDKSLTGYQDVVYLNLGEKDGVKPGDLFTVLRQGEKYEVPSEGILGFAKKEEKAVPETRAGEVRVISVQPHSSTARITDFSETLRAGYRVVYGAGQ